VRSAKLAAKVELLEQELAELKQLVATAGDGASRSFMRFKGVLKGWLDASDELLEECRLKTPELP
jgi:hypothetical protein